MRFLEFRRTLIASPAGPIGSGTARLQRAAWGVLVAALTVGAFLPVVQNGFVNWNDRVNLLDNPAYRGLGPRQLWWMLTTFHMGHWIPVTWLTLGFDYVLWGMDARGYHLTSLLFHTATAVAFYALAARLLERALPSGARATDINVGASVAALLFAVHPLRVESVAWVTERRDVVSGLFFVLTLLAYLKMAEAPADHRRGWYLTSLGLFACALLSKALTVALPVVLLVLDVYPLGRLGFARGWRRREIWFEKIPYVLMAALVAVRAIEAGPDSAKDPFNRWGLEPRLLISVHSLVFYLGKSVLPTRLSPLYAYPTQVGLDSLLTALVGALLVAVTWRHWPALAGAAVTYTALVFPVLGLFAVGPQAVADRYSYLPCLGWALLAGGGVAYRWSGVLVVRTAAAVALVALIALTAQQTRVWHDSVSLWTHAVQLKPAHDLAPRNLASAYVDEGGCSRRSISTRKR